MKDGPVWRVLQFVVDFLLVYWILTFVSGNYWVVIPIIAISVWNFIDGRLRPVDDIVAWPFLVIIVNAVLIYWILTFVSGNYWVLIPVVALSAWNFLDGRVRRNS
jgi:hypothetical protein